MSQDVFTRLTYDGPFEHIDTGYGRGGKNQQLRAAIRDARAAHVAGEIDVHVGPDVVVTFREGKITWSGDIFAALPADVVGA